MQAIPPNQHNNNNNNNTLRRLVLGIALVRLGRVSRHLLVVLLKGGEILAGFAELALLHALADVPVHKGALAVHEVELVVEARPGLGDGRRVGQHRDGAVDRGEPAVGGRGGRDRDGLLVVDADLEARGAPLDQVERRLGLERGNGGVAVPGHDVATVQESHGHVLAVAGVADDHLVIGLEAC